MSQRNPFNPYIVILLSLQVSLHSLLSLPNKGPTIRRVVFQASQLSHGATVQCYGTCENDTTTPHTTSKFTPHHCEGRNIQLRCPKHRHVRITGATFGLLDPDLDVCNTHARDWVSCVHSVKGVAGRICDDAVSCVIQVGDSGGGIAAASNCSSSARFPYVDIKYICQRSSMSYLLDPTNSKHNISNGWNQKIPFIPKPLGPKPLGPRPLDTKPNGMFFFGTAYTFLTDIIFMENHAAHLTLTLLLSMFVGLVLSLCVLFCRRRIDVKYLEARKEFLIDKSVTLQCYSDLQDFRESRLLSRISAIHSPPSTLPTDSIYSGMYDGLEKGERNTHPATLELLKGYYDEKMPYLDEIWRSEQISRENGGRRSPSTHIEPFRLCYMGENSPSGTLVSLDMLQYGELVYDDLNYPRHMFDSSTPIGNSHLPEDNDDRSSDDPVVDPCEDDILCDIEEKRADCSGYSGISPQKYLSYGNILPSLSRVSSTSQYDTSEGGYTTSERDNLTSERGCNCRAEARNRNASKI